MAKDPDHSKDEAISTMRSPVLRRREADLTAFRAYWDGLRRGADVPCRADVDPRGIEALLGEAFVAERIAPGLARLRIAGTHLSDLMGMEVRGMPLTALIDVEDRARLCDALVDLFERPAAIRLELAAAGAIRRGPMTGTMLILPLRSDMGDISRAIGCCVTTGTIGPAPRRFRITRCDITAIDVPASMPSPEPVSHRKPATMRARKKAALTSERPYLRLVHG